MCCVKHTCDDPSTSAVWIIKDVAVNRRGKKSILSQGKCTARQTSVCIPNLSIRTHKILSFLTSVSKVTCTFSNTCYYSGYNLYGNDAYFLVFYPFIAYREKNTNKQTEKKTQTLVHPQTLLVTKLWMIDRFFCVQWIQNTSESRPFDDCNVFFFFCVLCWVNKRKKKWQYKTTSGQNPLQHNSEQLQWLMREDCFELSEP